MNGGIHATAMFALMAGLLAVVLSVLRRRWWPMLALLATGAAAFCLSAPKLLPVAAFLRDARFVDQRVGIGDPGSLTWSEVATTLIGNRPADWSSWFEYGNYIGLLALSLAVGAAVTVIARRSSRSTMGIALAIAAVTCLLLIRGNFSMWSPFALLQHVPIYGGFREPSRYTLLFALLVPALIADAVRRTALDWPATARVMATAVLVIGTLDLAARNRTEFVGALENGQLAATAALRTRSGVPAFDTATTAWTPDSPMTRALVDNRDVVNCYDPLQLTRAVDPAAGYIIASRGTVVNDLDFTPNRVRMTVTTRDAGVVTLNQNYLTGWRASAGKTRAEGPNAPLQVMLPASFSGTVTIRFIPQGLWLALALFALGLVPLLTKFRGDSADTHRARR